MMNQVRNLLFEFVPSVGEDSDYGFDDNAYECLLSIKYYELREE
jgi:hypothetical protein